MQSEHNEEVKIIIQGFEEKYKAKVENLSQENYVLKKQLDQLESMHVSMKTQTQVECQKMVAELNTLRRSANVRQNQMLRERQKLQKELAKADKKCELKENEIKKKYTTLLNNMISEQAARTRLHTERSRPNKTFDSKPEKRDLGQLEDILRELEVLQSSRPKKHEAEREALRPAV